MSMDATAAQVTGARIDELQRENELLREQLRTLTVQQQAVHGAVRNATVKEETAARLAHQVAVEERATRAAVEVQASNLGFATIMTIVNFFVLLIILIGMFVWVPKLVAGQVAAELPRTTITAPPGAPVVVP